ncbi:MAG: hemerythrin family protein [Magnetococcales bacterium]|nr:hemerythrin family protein [Magnetococcales bacterium]
MSVGYAEIDQDHQRLVEIINEIYAPSLSTDSLRNLLLKTLAKLIDYTEFHFRREEKILEEHNYPYLEQHKAIHADLEQQVRDILERVEKDDAHNFDMQVMMEIMTFLRGWLFNHIDDEDMAYVNYIT